MDIETIDQAYNRLESQAQQTTQAITNLAQKLQHAAEAGDQNAREWLLDLKEIALGVRDEESQVSSLLQAIHQLIAAEAQQPVYQQAQQQYAQGGYGQGGMLHRLLGGGFGRAIAMGAGFGIGDDLINSIF